MSITKYFIATVFSLLFFTTLFSQPTYETVVAEYGDGILSILRKEGMDISKYYEPFLELNGDKLKNGSRLVVGETYLLPDAPDSLKKMGVSISIGDGAERPIFKGELASLKRKDSTLKNTVYYLIEHNKAQKEGVAMGMARNLLQSGSRVYLLERKAKDSLGLLDFASIVNRKYLKHHGHYQRLMIIDNGNVKAGTQAEVTVYHYRESVEGERFAHNILIGLGKNVVNHEPLDDYSEVFTDFENITFAKNILPPITYIDMDSKSDGAHKTLKVDTSNKDMTNLITNGILSDYTNTEFIDN
ncbi:hypothetical protein [Maribacter polysaccharolyticus]|uniref:hypothetical protein n=1 Tax=Maribacter polysaccharolyticus TaxID=3020831 RepID=UPI00237F6861|nr:hypothetical protein [Maribacter polysaccharolyticus]MDE3742903.1 hypothetical protein [Maribacter polysaccharolyticus]